jgi:hypothetical protein
MSTRKCGQTAGLLFNDMRSQLVSIKNKVSAQWMAVRLPYSALSCDVGAVDMYFNLSCASRETKELIQEPELSVSIA